MIKLNVKQEWYRDYFKPFLKRVHPQSLIRDVHVDYIDLNTMEVNYLVVNKDDTSMRRKLTIKFS